MQNVNCFILRTLDEELTITVVELRRTRPGGRRSLAAIGGRVDVARAGGTPMPEVQSVIDILSNTGQGIISTQDASSD